MLLSSALFLMGCATHKFAFDANKAAAYLAVHQDRPVEIKRALSIGRPARGMTEEEVLLCWGKATKILDEDISGRERTSWRYYEPQAIAYSGMRAVWADVLTKDVTFTNGIVVQWRELQTAR